MTRMSSASVDSCLTWWLSGSAVLTAAVTFGAALERGLTWASVNGLSEVHVQENVALTAAVPELTDSRVTRAGSLLKAHRLDYARGNTFCTILRSFKCFTLLLNR